MFKSKIVPILSATLALSTIYGQSAFSQVATTLRDPLVPGASSGLPFVSAPTGAPPAIGSGLTPLPVTPGMLAPQVLPTWIPSIPSNTINQASSGLGLPVSPPIATAPGVLGPLLTPFIPASPSTPGVDPGQLRGLGNPAVPTNVLPTGTYPGTGGYYSSVNKVPRLNRQYTAQQDYRGLNVPLGAGVNTAGGVMDEVSLLGPLAGYGVVNGVPTGVGYNKGLAGTNSDNYLSQIDLGGGMQTKVGNQVIPLGKTVQYFPERPPFYNNPIGALSAKQSFEYGQGLVAGKTAMGQGLGTGYNLTTDFGLPVNPALGAINGHSNEPGRALPQKVVETNF